MCVCVSVHGQGHMSAELVEARRSIESLGAKDEFQAPNSGLLQEQCGVVKESGSIDLCVGILGLQLGKLLEDRMDGLVGEAMSLGQVLQFQSTVEFPVSPSACCFQINMIAFSYSCCHAFALTVCILIFWNWKPQIRLFIL